MATMRLAPIALRAGRLAALCAAVSGVGCGHHRQSRRPVYVGPAIPAVPAASGSSSVIIDEPATTTTTPPAIEETDAGPDLTPARPSVDSTVNPARGGSPPAPAAPAEEPGLQMPSNPARERAPKSNIVPPELNGPAASSGLRSGVGRRTSSSRSRLATLQAKVKPFVNDPDDLFQPPKADRPWKFIVVHHSAQATGSYDQIDREHRQIQGWDGCGYHFVIGNGTGSPDGQIEVARRWSNQKHGLHCKSAKNPDVNEYGIGICLVGDFDAAPPTPKQIAAAKALVAYLEERYKVPAGSVGTHAELAGVASACPGKNFPEEEIFGGKHLVSK